MAQADSNNSIPSRRRFLTVAAAASAVSATALAAAAMPVQQTPLDDSALLKLEEQIFEQHNLAMAHNDEIRRLSEIWGAESNRLYEEALSREVQAATYLTPDERWAVVTEMTECKEHDRLCGLQEIHVLKMEALVKQMWAIPALTPEGRRAKVLVALRLLPDAGGALTTMPTMGCLWPGSSLSSSSAASLGKSFAANSRDLTQRPSQARRFTLAGLSPRDQAAFFPID